MSSKQKLQDLQKNPDVLAVLAVCEHTKGRQSAAVRSFQRRGFRSEKKKKKKLKILHNLFL